MGEIEDACDASQSAVSQFLNRMRLEGLVSSEKRGLFVYYKISEPNAYVTNPEADSPEINFENRYSVSIYNSFSIHESWDLDNSLIYGKVVNYDHAANLSSFAEEFWLHSEKCPSEIFARAEVLQRTYSELGIQKVGDQNIGRWVTALTLGYSYKIANWDSIKLRVGGSVTNDILPSDFQNAYGLNPWTEKIFLRISGIKMWDL